MEEISKKPGTLSLTIKDKEVLYTIYMRWVTGGGLFIPTTRPFSMGETVSIVLTLMDEPERYAVSGNVVWITPKGAQGNRAAGIGVQFTGEEGKVVQNKIENYLVTTLKSEKPTHTL